jgi:hypothetical protein
MRRIISGGHSMSKKERIVRYTDEELLAMQEHGEDKSNWAGSIKSSMKIDSIKFRKESQPHFKSNL